jgi:AAA+ superfamily predicted ATPase
MVDNKIIIVFPEGNTQKSIIDKNYYSSPSNDSVNYAISSFNPDKFVNKKRKRPSQNKSSNKRSRRRRSPPSTKNSINIKINLDTKTSTPSSSNSIKNPILSPPFKLDTIDDLLYIAWNYQSDDAFDSSTLWSMIPILSELNRLVGMTKLKKEVINLILYYIQNLHVRKTPSGNIISDQDLLHTVLYGGPGLGKTRVAHILAKLYCKMGYLPTETVIIAKKTDFIGKYIGHTEDKTMELLNKSIGGVLFIDEAYSMGHSERTDSFSKAAIDLLNQFLSEHKGEMVCIIAGYEKELNDCFFSVNPGLERRFRWKITIDPYTGEELYEMFCKKIKSEMWTMAENMLEKDFFSINIKSFPFFGGDIDNLFTFCKTSHSRRIFGNKDCVKKELSNFDVKEGFKSFYEHKQILDDNIDSCKEYSMYM